MSARRRRRTKRRFRRDRRGRFLPAVRRKRKRGRNPLKPFIVRAKAGRRRLRWVRFAHTLSAARRSAQKALAREYPSGFRLTSVRPARKDPRQNPLLQIVGYPLSRTGNPWGSVAQGFAMGVGADVAGRAMRKVWGRNPRRRNPPRPGQKIAHKRRTFSRRGNPWRKDLAPGFGFDPNWDEKTTATHLFNTLIRATHDRKIPADTRILYAKRAFGMAANTKPPLQTQWLSVANDAQDRLGMRGGPRDFEGATRKAAAYLESDIPFESFVSEWLPSLWHGKLNPRRRRNPPRPGQKILSERAMTVTEARRFPGFLAAANGYKRFHGSAPSSVSLVRIADGQKAVTRRAVFAMGKAPEMTYKPLPGQKTNKAGATWVHKMGEHGGQPPLLVHDPKSGVTSFVGGTFWVGDWVRH